jgi:hypothetical protein
MCVRDFRGDTVFDLRTRTSLTPYLKLTSKALTALTHFRKTPMAGSLATLKNAGVHANPIIAHPNR